MSRLQNLLSGLPVLDVALRAGSFETETTFPYFPKLPNELRDKVWDMVSHHRRDIKLFLHNGVRESFGDSSEVAGQSRIPIVLQVNRESRREALRHYLRVYERPRYKRIEGHEASSEIWYRTLNDLRMNRPAIETKAMRPNMLYINFVADQFLQHPMIDRIEKVYVDHFWFGFQVYFDQISRREKECN